MPTFRSSITPRLLLATVALALGANAQNAQKSPDLATAHLDDFTRQFATCVAYAQRLATEAETVEAELPCFKNEIAIQDRRLNINYKKAMLSEKPADQTGLRLYERVWIELRTNACAKEDKSLTGLDYLMTVLFARDCTLRWTRERTDQLEAK